MSYAHRGQAVKYPRIQKVQTTIQLFSAESSELAMHFLVIVVIICSSGHSLPFWMVRCTPSLSSESSSILSKGPRIEGGLVSFVLIPLVTAQQSHTHGKSRKWARRKQSAHCYIPLCWSSVPSTQKSALNLRCNDTNHKFKNKCSLVFLSGGRFHSKNVYPVDFLSRSSTAMST